MFLASVGGAWVADRLLGADRTVFYGGLAVLLGHLALASLPGPPGVAAGLLLLVLGSGGLTPNTTALGALLLASGGWVRRLMHGVH
ncbi:hypothetical protein [Crossiella cryophila]|uniref:Dipeptide/tripeptide permease n=1 Tax=Crossiella cryophila TaxID=43355 RepID=A0A7W7FUQ1_9PSEU|nr:hypothetical protein [Crossiella cryophila]MBB4677678.1 dipeptide/tripeptide permease [Crossiella cryophila]